MALNLITTKLMVPRPPQSVVQRPHLVEQLQTTSRTKLVLVSAPAGSGKSTLLASWLRILGKPTAWLSLDAGDNDLERFLLYLVSALQQVDPGLGGGLPDLLQRQGVAEAQSLIIQIINDVAQWGQELLLVLDDYHVISNQEIHRAVEFLLEHLPPGLCLVLASRTDPPLALSRLRVRRQMVEIRGEQLRFSVEETAAFLNDQLNLELSARAISNLEERTEGWVAGLQLAALSLEGRGDKEQFVERFAGSHRYLVDYLVDEVLSRQTPEMRQFLQRISILGRFTLPLCQTVAEQSVPPDLLARLEDANLFLIPLDDTRQWYRYHQLFAEFLQHRLQLDEPGEVARLHLLASEWLEQQGWSDEAIHHALRAGDLERAGRLVEAIAFSLQVSSNNAQLIRYVSRFPSKLLATLPRLGIYYGWALINTGQVELLSAALPVLEQSAAHAPQPQVVAACGLALRAYQCLWQMDFAGVVGLCQEALAVLDQSQAEPSTNEERWMRTAANNLMVYSYFHHDLAQADRVYPSATALSQNLGNFIGAANDFARHGRIKHQLGSLRQSLELFDEGLAVLERWQAVQGAQVVNVGELHVSLARLLYEWNRLEEAEHHLQKANQFNQHSQFPPVLALELETTAWLYLARGQIEAALEVLPRLDQMLSHAHPSNLLYKQMFGVMSMNLRLNLAASAPGLDHLLGEVGSWLETRRIGPEDSFAYPTEASYFVLARYLVAQGQTHQALLLLDRLIQAAEAEGRKDDGLRYAILKSLAAQRGGQEALALQSLQTAVAFAGAEGYCRSFVDQGARVQVLLQKLLASGQTHVQKLLAAFPQSGAGVEAVAASPQPPSPTPPLNGSLNERELTILRLLAGGNSNKEIGRVLGLSPDTVKWYIKGLFEKLEVSGRLEAVNRARELGLV